MKVKFSTEKIRKLRFVVPQHAHKVNCILVFRCIAMQKAHGSAQKAFSNAINASFTAKNVEREHKVLPNRTNAVLLPVQREIFRAHSAYDYADRHWVYAPSGSLKFDQHI